MAEGATRTRTIWKRDQHGSYAVTITEPAAWWRRGWESVLWNSDLIAGIVGPVLFVLAVVLAIALASSGGPDRPGDSTDPPPTFPTGPSPTPPTTPPPLPSPPLR